MKVGVLVLLGVSVKVALGAGLGVLLGLGLGVGEGCALAVSVEASKARLWAVEVASSPRGAPPLLLIRTTRTPNKRMIAAAPMNSTGEARRLLAAVGRGSTSVGSSEELEAIEETAASLAVGSGASGGARGVRAESGLPASPASRSSASSWALL